MGAEVWAWGSKYNFEPPSTSKAAPVRVGREQHGWPRRAATPRPLREPTPLSPRCQPSGLRLVSHVFRSCRRVVNPWGLFSAKDPFCGEVLPNVTKALTEGQPAKRQTFTTPPVAREARCPTSLHRPGCNSPLELYRRGRPGRDSRCSPVTVRAPLSNAQGRSPQ